MSSALSQFHEVKTKNKYNFVVMTLIFVAAMIGCAAEHFNLFSSLASRGLLFYGVIIFAIFLYILWLPSFLVPRITSAYSLIAIILCLLSSIFLKSITLYQFIFEIVMLAAVYLYSVLRYMRIKRKLSKLSPDDTLMMHYNYYKQYELNIVTFIVNCIAIFAIVFSGVSVVTVVFACISVIIVVLSCYRRLFRIRLNSSKKSVFILEIGGIIACYLLLLLCMVQSLPVKFYLLIILPVLPHWYNSLVVWRELSTVLFH